jgi:hypothetical protein
MKIGILQPGYLPWLGFFEQIYKTDIFVMYDDVQYDKHGWRNRNRIKTSNGVQWLTVPVSFTLKDSTLIKDVKIDNKQNWRKKHLSSLCQNYSKAKFYKEYIDFFEKLYTINWENLIDIDIFIIEKLIEKLEIKNKKIIKSSELGIESDDTIKRLIDICKYFNADFFYEGAAGKKYINCNDFEKNGIKIEFQNYNHPVYEQLYGEFVPYLSVIDLLFNNGEKSLSILLNKN